MQGCSVDASWLEIVRSPETGRYSTGGLGKRMVLDEYEVWLCDRHDPCVRGMRGCVMGTDQAFYQCSSEFGPQLEETSSLMYSGALNAFDGLERLCDVVGQYHRCLPAACCEASVKALRNATDNPFALYGYPCEIQCANDWMCYAYNEKYGQFEPLSLNSRLKFVKDVNTSTSSNVSVSNIHPVESSAGWSSDPMRYGLPAGTTLQTASGWCVCVCYILAVLEAHLEY